MLNKMYQLFSVIALLLTTLNVSAKDKKPTMLVFGSTMEAFSAALQASRSNVPTLWVVPGKALVQELELNNTHQIRSTNSLDGGIWKELMTKLSGKDTLKDSLETHVKQNLSFEKLREVMHQLAKAEPNLQIAYNTQILGVRIDKKDIEIQLSNKQKLSIRAMLDASEDASLRSLYDNSAVYSKPGRIDPINIFSLERQRTLIAYGEYNEQVFGYSLLDVLSRTKGNIFSTASLIQVGRDEQSLSLRSSLGQAIGAAAAYCAFFKVNTDKIDVRKLQTELITYKARLLPYKNIATENPNFDALQKIYLTGILKTDSTLVFPLARAVQLADVKPVFNQLYSRAQLWFMDNNPTYLTMGDVVSLIKMIAFRADEIDKEIVGRWNKGLHLKGQYEGNALITANEFAVLLSNYADPFTKAVTQEGNIIR